MDYKKITKLGHEAFVLADRQSLIELTFEQMYNIKFAELIINECIAEIDSFEIIDRNGTPIEQVADALMRVKCGIRERFAVEPQKPVVKTCSIKEKHGGVCPLHNLHCQYPNCLV